MVSHALLISSCYIFAVLGQNNTTQEGLNCHTTVNIYSITTVSLSAIWGRDIVGAQRIYLNELNKNDSIFPNYTFELKVFDSNGSTIEALKHALYIIQHKDNLILNDSDGNNCNKQVLLPMVLGPPWSSMSAIATPVLSGFSFGQISSSSTSVQLSDTDSFAYFYRTPPSDNVQSIGIIKLCQLFGWNKIAIMYLNNAYGLYLTVDILNLALQYDIEAFSISYELFDKQSYEAAAKQIYNLNVYIILLISYGEMVYDIMYYGLKPLGMNDYPYYIIGDSGWFDEGAIRSFGYGEFINGFMGLVLWQVDALPYERYNNSGDNKIIKFYHETLTNYHKFQELWDNTFEENPDIIYNTSSTTVWAPYGYDAMHTIVEMLVYYDENIESIENMWNGNTSQEQVMQYFKRIIINETNFIGVTGNVSFDKNGDRDQGLYLVGNYIDDNQTINYLYFYDESTQSITASEIDTDSITWPKGFVDVSMVPQSSPITIQKKQVLDTTLVIVVSVFLFLSMIIVIIMIVLLLKYRNAKIIKSASYRLNIIACFGAVLCLFSIFLFGIDEGFAVGAHVNLNCLCNVRIWLLSVSLTLLFMPFFFKTYRISILLSPKHALEETKIADKHLLYGICLCLGIDLVLLTLLYILFPFSREIETSKIEILDELRYKQYEYGICICKSNNGNTHNTTLFMIIIGIWKLIQILFGGFEAIIVSQIIGFKQLIARLDETGSQIITIFITISLIPIMICAEFFQSPSNINFHYCIFSIFLLIIIDITIMVNVSQRLYYVILHKDEKFLQAAEKKIEILHKTLGIDSTTGCGMYAAKSLATMPRSRTLPRTRSPVGEKGIANNINSTRICKDISKDISKDIEIVQDSNGSNPITPTTPQIMTPAMTLSMTPDSGVDIPISLDDLTNMAKSIHNDHGYNNDNTNKE